MFSRERRPCLCVPICICKQVHVHTNVFMRAYVTPVCVYVCPHTCMCTCVTYTVSCVRIVIQATKGRATYACMYVIIRIHVTWRRKLDSEAKKCIFTPVCVCVCVYIYICMNICIHTLYTCYIPTYIHTYIHTFTQIFSCIYTYIHTPRTRRGL